jgi:hypothetical protein
MVSFPQVNKAIMTPNHYDKQEDNSNKSDIALKTFAEKIKFQLRIVKTYSRCRQNM